MNNVVKMAVTNAQAIATRNQEWAASMPRKRLRAINGALKSWYSYMVPDCNSGWESEGCDALDSWLSRRGLEIDSFNTVETARINRYIRAVNARIKKDTERCETCSYECCYRLAAYNE